MIEGVLQKYITFKAKWAAGLSSVVLACLIATIVFITTSKPVVHAGVVPVVLIREPSMVASNTHTPIPKIAPVDSPPSTKALLLSHLIVREIPTNEERNIAVVTEGISKNPEVVLTEHQAIAVTAFGEYLKQIKESAIVTSGKRTSDGQLDIIKQRIAEHGALSKFPLIAHATVASTKTWLKAWLWLRSQHVPVNAPAAVAGVEVRTSMHLKGLAVDFISSNLDHLRGLLADFARSKFAQSAGVRIVAIVREPGCIHINLS